MRTQLLATCTLFLALTTAAPAWVNVLNKTDFTEIHVVPAAQVTIDGELKDWDFTGAILMCLDPASKDSYSLQAAMMYDTTALYIGGHVKDPTPLINNYNLKDDVNMSWNADAVQVRVFSNPNVISTASSMSSGRDKGEKDYICHLTLWHSTRDQKAGLYICYTLDFQGGQVNPPGVEGAYRKDADGKGYTFEYRIPYAVLHTPRPYTGGDKFQAQFQMHWGMESGQGLRCGMTDLRSAAGGSNLGYMGPASWGTAVVEAKGNLPASPGAGASRAAGHIPITFKLDQERKVSLALFDADDNPVRTCLGGQPYPAGTHTYLWDGLSDTDKPLPAGTYSYRILTHAGIKQKYLCDVGISGTPPYQTEDGTGGWAGDYRRPELVAATGDRVVLGTTGAEAAPMAIITDLDGRKLCPVGSGSGARAVAAHEGYGYFAMQTGVIQKFSLANGFLGTFTNGRADFPVRAQLPGEDAKAFGGRMWNLRALAFLGNSILACSGWEGCLYKFDLASGAPQGQWQVADKGDELSLLGVATVPAGDVYVIYRRALGRYNLESKQFTPVVPDLDEPQFVASDKDGNLYVALAGKTMQVWKVSPKGDVLLKFGRAGGRPLLGTFDPAGMLNPACLAVDANGRLWVAEADDQPKRYSAWNADGTLYRQFFGSVPYSTRACVDPATPDAVYLEGVRYHVDYDKGDWTTDATVLRQSTQGDVLFQGCSWVHGGNHAGGTYVNLQGRKFFMNRGPYVLYEVVNDTYVPRFKQMDRKGSVWIDANNNGQFEKEEVIQTAYKGSGGFGGFIDAKLNLYTYDGSGYPAQGHATAPKSSPKILRWNFAGFNAQGGLQYGDPLKFEPLAAETAECCVADICTDPDGSVYVMFATRNLKRGERAQGSGHRIAKYSPAGKKLWDYQNVQVGFAWNAAAYTPGFVVAAVLFSEQSSPQLLAITGYCGHYFLLDKKDGLFVDALGEDQRGAFTMGPHMVLTENFNGCLYERNGKTYFIGGDADARIWELTGLETLKRDSGSVRVTEKQVAQSRQNSAQNMQAATVATGVKQTLVPRLKSSGGTVKEPEWRNVPQLPILVGGDGRSAIGQLGYDDTYLFVRFTVQDESPFRNTPNDYKLLFKTGDAVEIQLGTNLGQRAVRGQNMQNLTLGDLRLVLARSVAADNAIQHVITCYRPKLEGKDKPNQASFETQSSGKITFDEITPWTDVPFHSAVGKDNYEVTIAIPWARLGITPKSGLTLGGDLGVIYGNEGGTRNAIRYLWSDKSPEVSINNDIPSEAQMHPNQWGQLRLE